MDQRGQFDAADPGFADRLRVSRRSTDGPLGDDPMTTTALTKNEPIKVALPAVGDLFIRLVTSTRLVVQSRMEGLKISGLLYHLSANANRIGSEWVLEHDSIQLKGLRGKTRTEFLEFITAGINNTMEQHADAADRLAVEAWLQQYEDKVSSIRRARESAKYNHDRWQSSVRYCQNQEDALREFMKTKPEGLELPPVREGD
jgi:hypothetical protein